jgi:hypothetical protein
MTDIVLINQSTVLSDAEIQAVIPALQAQVSEDWLAHWPGRGATLHFASASHVYPSAWWPLYILDHTDVAGAGGYHDDDGGLPQGKVFAADAMMYGEAWTVDASHEALEMLGDPTVNAIVPLPHFPRYHCYQEVCDAVEADQFGYSKPRWPHVRLSDFCYPSYFTGQLDSSRRFDAMGHLNAPAPALLSGGYLGIELPNGHWTQIVQRRADGRMSRRAQRIGRTARRLA